ncbi:MAG: hypothetical protein DMF65_10475 [Acidobacteria bacterium]|nr:MAG: hypothetical protein DMF65_10475 [Acidobacteriota bacterium]
MRCRLAAERRAAHAAEPQRLVGVDATAGGTAFHASFAAQDAGHSGAVLTLEDGSIADPACVAHGARPRRPT